MNLTRLVLLVAAGVVLTLPLQAQTSTAAPWTPDKQFTADQIITTKGGMTIASKVYVDNGKVRSEMNMQGMDMVQIIRPDEKKMYSVMVAQKMVMEMNLDPEKTRQLTASSSGEGAKFDLMGSEIADGLPCLKYKMTVDKDNKVFFWWINASTLVPVKMTSEDGSFALSWKNYKAGPQDAALFEPPAGYQVMAMPSGMGAPGGSPGAPGQ